MEEAPQSPESSQGPKLRPPGTPARLDSLREKLVTSIGALVNGLSRSNSSNRFHTSFPHPPPPPPLPSAPSPPLTRQVPLLSSGPLLVALATATLVGQSPPPPPLKRWQGAMEAWSSTSMTFAWRCHCKIISACRLTLCRRMCGCSKSLFCGLALQSQQAASLIELKLVWPV